MTAGTPTADMGGKPERGRIVSALWRPAIYMPLLSILTAFLLGGVVIFITSGSLQTVVDAYVGLLYGALFKERGLSESLVASIPYVLLGLAVAVGFKAGLFNIGVEGQFYIGAICAAWAGQAVRDVPAFVHLPLTLLAGAIGGAAWAAIPGYLKARTGAHEVITTIMMNYIAFRLAELIISGPLKDPGAGLIQTPSVSPEAELWAMFDVANRLQNPLNALAVGALLGLLAYLLMRWLGPKLAARQTDDRRRARWTSRWLKIGVAAAAGLAAFVLLPALATAWWPFKDQYDRLHIGLFFAVAAAVFVWWLLWKTTVGFELRTVGANPNAARYAGANITRNIVLAMAISGALAGLAGTVEVLGVSICRCLPLFFSSGYGFDAIAISLLAKNNPFGILATAFLFGAMRNGADLMELSSGVSKYIITLIQALVLLFVAAPQIVRWMYHIRGAGKLDEGAPITRGWGGH